MVKIKNLKDILFSTIKDKKIIFLIIASLLITISSIVTYRIPSYQATIYKTILIGISFSFSWVIVAWILTDRSILRKILPYLSIFILILLDKIYWSIFNYFYPPPSTRDILFSENYALANNWYLAYENAYYLHIIIKFLIMIFVFVIFWYLTKPRDFREKYGFLKKKNMLYVFLASFFMTMPLWLSRALFYLIGVNLLHSFIKENLLQSLFYFTIGGIPFIISLFIFSIIITNIKTKKRFILYGIIILSSLIYLIPLYDFGLWNYSTDIILISIYFVIYGICYFFIYLCFLLLSKTKYIEQ